VNALYDKYPRGKLYISTEYHLHKLIASAILKVLWKTAFITNTKYMSYDFKSYKNDTLTRPRDEAWGNWKSWKNAVVGEKVQGFIADAFYRPAEGDDFREQRGITLKQADGVLINVGVKFLPFVLVSTDKLRIGDPLTVELTEIQEPASKAKQGAKIFGYFGANIPESEGNKTVKKLTDEDRIAVGTAIDNEVEEPVEGIEAF